MPAPDNRIHGKIDSRVQIALAIVGLIGAGIYAWATFSHFGGLPPKPNADRLGPPSAGRGPGGPLAELNLTAEQQKKLEALRTQDRMTTGPESFEQRRQAFEEILTPEQREQMRQRMQSRMERMRKVLSDQDLKALERRMEERRRRGPPPGGRRGGGGQGGPPPGGPPPN